MKNKSNQLLFEFHFLHFFSISSLHLHLSKPPSKHFFACRIDVNVTTVMRPKAKIAMKMEDTLVQNVYQVSDLKENLIIYHVKRTNVLAETVMLLTFV